MKVTNEQATLIRNNVECTIIMDRVSSIDIASDLLEARAQRDELLAALEEKSFDTWWFNTGNETHMSKRPGGYDFSKQMWDAIYAPIRATIAKVEADK